MSIPIYERLHHTNILSNAWSDAARAAALEARRRKSAPGFSRWGGGAPTVGADVGTTASGKAIPHFNHPSYTMDEPRSGWSVRVHALMDPREGGKILRTRMSDWSKQDHLDAHKAHSDAAKKASEDWGKAQEEAHKRTFGESPQPWDYKVSGIGRDEYSEEDKNRLRSLATAKTQHSAAADAHWYASGKRNRP